MILHKSSGTANGDQRLIRADDLVIVYERHDSMKSVCVTPGQTYGNRYGNFKLKDWVGKPFGSRVQAFGQNATGWVYLLAPTPELWSLVLRHRTQILYIADISMVCTFLELKPGCTVLESGTGSGSLTHSLARAIAPTGHVHTFEFHQLRAEAADKEFKQHAMGDLITVQQRNIEELGFPEGLHGKADGLFLDLPGPWHAVESAAQCLKPDGVFCSFSPCIEQVQRTCAALEEHGFYAVRTVECLLRHYEVRQERFATCEDLEALDNQQGSSKRKRHEEQQSRKKQVVAQDTPDNQPNLPHNPLLPAQANDGSTPMSVDDAPAVGQLDNNGAAGIQQQQTEPVAAQVQTITRSVQLFQPQSDQQGTTVTAQSQSTKLVTPSSHQANAAMVEGATPGASQSDTIGQASAAVADGPRLVVGQNKAKPEFEQRVVARPLNEARGHTGYLTFARKSVDE